MIVIFENISISCLKPNIIKFESLLNIDCFKEIFFLQIFDVKQDQNCLNSISQRSSKL